MNGGSVHQRTRQTPLVLEWSVHFTYLYYTYTYFYELLQIDDFIWWITQLRSHYSQFTPNTHDLFSKSSGQGPPPRRAQMESQSKAWLTLTIQPPCQIKGILMIPSCSAGISVEDNKPIFEVLHQMSKTSKKHSEWKKQTHTHTVFSF